MNIEEYLADRDPTLGRVIGAQSCQWDWNERSFPVRELIRIVVAQQISTKAAATIWERILSKYPGIGADNCHPEIVELRQCGLTSRKAQTVAILAGSVNRLTAAVNSGGSWEDNLKEVAGVGPWTIDIFRIMVLRRPDVLPESDVGLIRAVRTAYGAGVTVSAVASKWQPYRSVACWYLWRSLGNLPLG
jgi:DNA-3-methyladenine glycosylase II